MSTNNGHGNNNNNNSSSVYNNLFTSLISDIKSYNGIDPLLPWLRGIRKMKETLSPHVLKEKLPRFLQKCCENFLNDRRYSNDLRYLRVWLQLMDFVDDPKAVLRTMEMNRVGVKRSLFYQAYALYYEKMKKFDLAEKIYHLGVENLAEPADELQKSYDQFLQRMERHRHKRNQQHGRKTNNERLNHDEVRSCKENSHRTGEHVLEEQAKFVNNKMVPSQISQTEISLRKSDHGNTGEKCGDVGLLNDQFPRMVVLGDSGLLRGVELDDKKKVSTDDTVVVKFVDTAIVGKSNAEDARHHGLVEPTINTKEAMNAINNMFREPIEPPIAARKSRNQPKAVNNLSSGFEVFTDESLSKDTNQPLDEPFQIYVDGDETTDNEKVSTKDVQPQSCSVSSISNNHVSVLAKPKDLSSECFKDLSDSRPHQAGLREDTVVHRFVGLTISDESKVENVWHHGLVEPTINLKEAMDDINSMFGKPIEYVRKSRPKKHDKAPYVKNNSEGFLILPDDDIDNKSAEDDTNCMFQNPIHLATKCSQRKREKECDVMDNHSGFLILPDDEIENQPDNSLPSSSAGKEIDLFEQTLCTKEAMAEINKLFAMPMDF